MLWFKKERVKLSLIEDYVSILVINNFYNNSFEDIANKPYYLQFKEIKDLNLNLKVFYEEIFNKLKMNDLSLLILKKEIKQNNSMFETAKENSFNNIESTINTFKLQLFKIKNNLSTKLKMLKFNSDFILAIDKSSF